MPDLDDKVIKARLSSIVRHMLNHHVHVFAQLLALCSGCLQEIPGAEIAIGKTKNIKWQVCSLNMGKLTIMSQHLEPFTAADPSYSLAVPRNGMRVQTYHHKLRSSFCCSPWLAATLFGVIARSPSSRWITRSMKICWSIFRRFKNRQRTRRLFRGHTCLQNMELLPAMSSTDLQHTQCEGQAIIRTLARNVRHDQSQAIVCNGLCDGSYPLIFIVRIEAPLKATEVIPEATGLNQLESESDIGSKYEKIASPIAGVSILAAANGKRYLLSKEDTR